MTNISLAQIIKDAGGAGAIERASQAIGVKLKRDAVYKWPLTGIPDRHWPIVIGLSGHQSEEIYLANCNARGVSPVAEMGGIQ